MVTRRLTDGNDVFFGHAADDMVSGLGGNDELHGGAGNDRLYGQSGNDKLFGDAGDDRLFGGLNADEIYGGNGKDYIDASGGNDFVRTNDAAHDTVFLGSGNDSASTLGDTVDAGIGDDGVFVGNLRTRVSDGVFTIPKLSQGTHSIVTLGDGADGLTGELAKNGAHDVIDVKDFKPGEDIGMIVYTTKPALVAPGSGGIVHEVFDHENGVANFSGNTPQVVGHDLVFDVNGTDHDQLILRGAADWLHA